MKRRRQELLDNIGLDYLLYCCRSRRSDIVMKRHVVYYILWNEYLDFEQIGEDSKHDRNLVRYAVKMVHDRLSVDEKMTVALLNEALNKVEYDK